MGMRCEKNDKEEKEKKNQMGTKTEDYRAKKNTKFT